MPWSDKVALSFIQANKEIEELPFLKRRKVPPPPPEQRFPFLKYVTKIEEEPPLQPIPTPEPPIAPAIEPPFPFLKYATPIQEEPPLQPPPSPIPTPEPPTPPTIEAKPKQPFVTLNEFLSNYMTKLGMIPQGTDPTLYRRNATQEQLVLYDKVMNKARQEYTRQYGIGALLRSGGAEIVRLLPGGTLIAPKLIEKPYTIGDYIWAGVDAVLAGVWWGRPLVRTATEQVFKSVLNTGLDRWIAKEARLIPEGIIRGWLAKNPRIVERATENMLRRMAERKGPEYASRSAAKDTLKSIIRLWADERGGIRIPGGKASDLIKTFKAPELASEFTRLKGLSNAKGFDLEAVRGLAKGVPKGQEEYFLVLTKGKGAPDIALAGRLKEAGWDVKFGVIPEKVIPSDFIAPFKSFDEVADFLERGIITKRKEHAIQMGVGKLPTAEVETAKVKVPSLKAKPPAKAKPAFEPEDFEKAKAYKSLVERREQLVEGRERALWKTAEHQEWRTGKIDFPTFRLFSEKWEARTAKMLAPIDEKIAAIPEKAKVLAKRMPDLEALEVKVLPEEIAEGLVKAPEVAKPVIPKAGMWKLVEKTGDDPAFLIYRGEMSAPQGLLRIGNKADAENALRMLSSGDVKEARQAYHDFGRPTAGDERWLKNQARLPEEIKPKERRLWKVKEPTPETNVPMTENEVMQFFESQKVRPAKGVEGIPPVGKPPTGVIPEAVPAIEREWATALGRMRIEPAGVATAAQRTNIENLARQNKLLTEAGKLTPGYRRLAKSFTGKTNPLKMTEKEADDFLEALTALKWKGGKPPKIPLTAGLMTKEMADKIPLLSEIGFLEQVRPSRYVFEKIGLRKELYEPAFAAESKVFNEVQIFQKELLKIRKLVSKDRKAFVFRELENPGTIKDLTQGELTAIKWFRQYFDNWADMLKLPVDKRRTNYVTHIFEKEIESILKAKHPLDPDLVRALDWVSPKRVFNPFLEKRLGRVIGLKEDPFSAALAYQSRALKVFYYDPLLQQMAVWEKMLPPNSARYLRGFMQRMTNRPLLIDREMNQTLREFGMAIKHLPGGARLAEVLGKGNPAGMIAHQYASALYFLWLGFRPTSAIRNLSQHILAVSEVGTVNLAKGIALRVTKKGKEALSQSTVLASRPQAYMPGIDSSFASRWTDRVRETSLWAFRKVDLQNVSDSFLAGYAEAIGKGLPIEWAIKRGDEVAANTQYIYSRLGGAAWSQSSIGRFLSPLTTWPENFVELLSKWTLGKGSYVYKEFAAQTGKVVEPTNWILRQKEILTFLGILTLAYLTETRTQFKALQYTGWTSIGYLVNIVKGQPPSLEIPGAVAEIVGGAMMGDSTMIRRGWKKLQRNVIPNIVGQVEDVAAGDKNWLTLFIYLHPENIVLKGLGKKWEDDLVGYYEQGVGGDRARFRLANPEVDAKLFVLNKVMTLKSREAERIVLELIRDNKINTNLIKGYDAIFPEGREGPIPMPTPTPFPKYFQQWRQIRPELDSILLNALDKVWNKGGELTEIEERRLRSLSEKYPFEQTNFNTWLNQTLRQIFENVAIDEARVREATGIK